MGGRGKLSQNIKYQNFDGQINEANAFLKRTTQEFMPGEWRDALAQYQGFLYEDINYQLRTGQESPYVSKDKIDPLIKNIDLAMNKARLIDSVQVFRGITGDIVDQLKPGNIVQDKGFMSTSMLKDVASRFLGGIGADATRLAIVSINVPKGYQALSPHFAGKTTQNTEQELLLKRNTKLKITSITEKLGVKFINAEVIP
jgi:hypothetical protein